MTAGRHGLRGLHRIGAIGLGIVIDKDPLSAGRVLALSLILGVIVLARITNPE